MDTQQFTCSYCQHTKPVQHSGSTGYGLDTAGNQICYDCCGKLDHLEMHESGNFTGYLSRDPAGKWKFINWPGTMSYPVQYLSHSWHNMAGKNGRTDFWFIDEYGRQWHGLQIGHDSTIARVKRNKVRR